MIVDVEVEEQAWLRDLPDVKAVAVLATHLTLPTAFKDDPNRIADEVDILLTSDEEVQTLNARFRGKNAPTNVLSFPAPESAGAHLGDIALAYGVCAREAAEHGKTLSDHLSHLVVHGVLHLLSYDHETDADAEVMEAMERDILGRLGIADPYRYDLADAGP